MDILNGKSQEQMTVDTNGPTRSEYISSETFIDKEYSGYAGSSNGICITTGQCSTAQIYINPEDQNENTIPPNKAHTRTNQRNSEQSYMNSEEKDELEIRIETMHSSSEQTGSVSNEQHNSVAQVSSRENSHRKRARTEAEKKHNNRQNHPFIADDCNCRTRKCNTFSKEERRHIYKQFWEMGKQEQRIWLSARVNEVKAKRKVEGTKRQYIRKYSFLKDDLEVEVCQKFFLFTLGYRSTSVIECMLKACKDEHGIKRLVPLKDKRGCHEPGNKINCTPIKQHISSFNPKPSHYRRDHAPNRKYLPSDLTIKEMYEDFKTKYTMYNFSYEKYRKTISEMNIGFYELEADKCGFCIEVDMNPSEENLNLKEDHLKLVRKAREEYKKDTEIPFGTTRVYSADLQKVFLLPRMPKIKDSFFTSRLVVFNETFGAKTKQGKHYCVIWHEATAGRRAEDITCAFLKFLDCNRDAEHIILWLDNCGGQNKNTVLLTGLLTYMNSALCCIKSITLKYLVSGHTYMAADGLHGKIEQVIRRTGNVEDFADFSECCKKASAKMNVVEMHHSDFRKIESKIKIFQRKKSTGDEAQVLPYFKDMVLIQVLKGSESIYAKTDYDQETCIEYNNVLRKNIQLKFLPPTEAPRGISVTKKETIIHDLVPKMRENRRTFWITLPENENAPDVLEDGL